jgi:hypothetical protein
MIGNLKVQMSATFIPDPEALIREIEHLRETIPITADVLMTLNIVKALIQQASHTDYVFTEIDQSVMAVVETDEYMGFVTDKLKSALGDRVLTTIDPITTQREAE